MEFQRPEDASNAAICNEHIIHGKKASIQFFKTKDTMKPSGIHEKPKRSEYGYMGCSSSFMQHSSKYSEYGTFYEFAGDNVQQNHICQLKADATKVHTRPVNSRYAASEPKTVYQRQHSSEFYASLGSADYKRYLAETYSEENLRFNLPLLGFY